MKKATGRAVSRTRRKKVRVRTIIRANKGQGLQFGLGLHFVLVL